MCRLFAFVSPELTTAKAALGVGGLDSLLSLARLHGDGWGWAGVGEPGILPVSTRSPRSAASEPAFGAALTTSVRAAIVHLRWATAGLPVNERNTHPFEGDGIAFAHNGTIGPFQNLHALVPSQRAVALTGTTDSEMYFALIREQLALGLPLQQASAEVAHRLRELFPLASLNALILDHEQLVIVHASAPSILTDHDLARLAPFAADLPHEHNKDYFGVRMRSGADGSIMIGSTGVAGDGWTPLPAESVTTIRLDDLHSSTVELTSVGATQS